MTDAVAIAQEQIAFWLRHDIDAIEAWMALTGTRRSYVSWNEVRGFMIGWLLKQQHQMIGYRAA